MLNDRTSTLTLLRTRRSGRPREMVAPGPDAVALEELLRIATRIPDHGKLAPWRFVIIEDRDAFAQLLADAYRVKRPNPGRLEIKANAEFARQAPALVAVLARPNRASKIPVWEQTLSVGAAIYNLQLAATAMGYVAGWVTGWAAYSPQVIEGLGGAAGDQIAGFLFIGTPSRGLEERPRPELELLVSRWPAGNVLGRLP